MLLLGFFVRGVFLAEPAVLCHFKPVRVVFLVLHGVVVALFALCTRQCNFYSHFRHLLFFSEPPSCVSVPDNAAPDLQARIRGIDPAQKIAQKNIPHSRYTYSTIYFAFCQALFEFFSKYSSFQLLCFSVKAQKQTYSEYIFPA